MSLVLLPDLRWPVNVRQLDPLHTSLVQLNILDKGLSEETQRALSIHFHVFDTWIKSGGKIDYRGKDGHRKLYEDAAAFCGGSSIVTRHGDLAAAHLALDYHDTQMRLKQHGHPALPDSVDELLKQCTDCALPVREQKLIGLFLDYLGKRPLI